MNSTHNISPSLRSDILQSLPTNDQHMDHPMNEIGGTAIEDEWDNDCSDADSVVSETESIASTTKYSQEPLATFQHKVPELMLNLWPDLYLAEIKVEYMEGGGYNRVIGITRFEPKRKLSFIASKSLCDFISNCIDPRARSCRIADQYVLRIPRSHINNTTGIDLNNDIRSTWSINTFDIWSVKEAS